MPRPTQQRRSLPAHSKAASRHGATRSTVQDDDLIGLSAGDQLMRPRDTQPAKIPFDDESRNDDDEALDEDPALSSTTTPGRPFPAKQTKATKQHLKRQALLDQITSSQQPYSKSHARRMKRAAKPENNLVADLRQVEQALPPTSWTTTSLMGDALGMQHGEEVEQEDVDVGMEEGGVRGLKGGKGKEKLTAKKRSRVLESEASRLPAVLTNKDFKKDAFAAIRLHMMNQIEAEKETRSKEGQGRKKGAK
ncbi:BZ3500_MvSof-1268-A1-R1_Chr7-1g09318 [Microbotryum saponariae]|uniref:Ribosome biogenesis protein SLX9 n=1 Tax=Microbotryum saponariae TaxID=289078 RepID=A0A2X0M2J3_9BASI|nr:BZ3501_MvSof-1269-A2-R1_Chr7-1g09023 [Microbotryum saponariae]SDA03225.1 BZ3500_MvSof-1268-A1-R1_Chr7-1g09318 [Microbotryum saponariae]